MKRVFDWKCSLYSLTVCLDSMSRFPLYLFLLSFFSHILPISGISDTSRLLDLKNPQNSSAIPLQLGSLKRRGKKRTTCSVAVLVGKRLARCDGETGNMQGFHLDSFGGGAPWRCNSFFEDFVPQIVRACSLLSVLVLHLTVCKRGAKTAFLWWPKYSSCFI